MRQRLLSQSRARFDIEALRALAVGSVLLFHAGIGIGATGYVGVDIFFVISGYLIVGLLHREWQRTGTIALLDFWARRARRLLPASALVTLVTAVIAWPLAGRLTQGEIKLDLVAAALYVANLRFATAGADYWAADYVSPALHFWSLAVEEQFYLITPLFILGVLLVKKQLPAKWPAYLLGASIALSFAYCLWLMSTNPVLGYYSTFTRAWEFAVGGLAAVAPAAVLDAGSRRWLRRGAWLVLFWSAVFLLPDFAWPNLETWLPVAATAVVLRLGVDSRSIGEVIAQARPQLRPIATAVAWLGGISYSAYLWHWPMLWAAATYLRLPTPGALPLGVAAAVLVLALGLAQLTKVYVEDPVRFHISLVGSVKRSLATGWAASTGAAVVVVAVSVLPAFTLVPPPSHAATATPTPTHAPVRLSADQALVMELIAKYVPASDPSAKLADAQPAIGDLRADKPWAGRTRCIADKTTAHVMTDCYFGDPAGKATVVLFGDSHAEQYFSGIDEAARQLGLKLLLISKPSCPNADVHIWLYHEQRAYPECDQFREEAFQKIQELRPALVITSSLVTYWVTDPKTGKVVSQKRGQKLWRAGLQSTLRRLTETSPVLLVRDLPNWGFDVADCLATYSPGECVGQRQLSAKSDDLLLAEGMDLVTGIDLQSAVCGRQCYPLRGGAIVVRDDTHLSATYSKVLAPLWTELLRGLQAS